jgi:hypothetical protein
MILEKQDLGSLFWKDGHKMQLRPSVDVDRALWDSFVRKSKNGTFLFLRNYMEYHKDRFDDFSLLFYDEKGRLLGLFPANRDGKILVSHGGLTYGGFILGEKTTTKQVLGMMENLLLHARSEGVEQIVYKAVPYIYHRIPSQDDLYALFRFGAKLYRRDVSTTVIPSHPAGIQKRRFRGAKKAALEGVVCREEEKFSSFWEILEWNLMEMYKTKPVHSLQEIEYLKRHFPENIRLFGAFFDGKILAGTVVYETDMVAHAQYIASSDVGRRKHALDALFLYLINEVYKEKPFFDFGISTEQNGFYLNSGLIEFKEGFGGRAVVYDSYVLSV